MCFRMGYSVFCRRSDRWTFLQNLMKTWELLRKEEHSFLVEVSFLDISLRLRDILQLFNVNDDVKFIDGKIVVLCNNLKLGIFQAIERLHVNQLVNEKCMESLEYAMSRLQSAGEKNIHHALLVVNSKLLSLYSK